MVNSAAALAGVAADGPAERAGAPAVHAEFFRERGGFRGVEPIQAAPPAIDEGGDLVARLVGQRAGIHDGDRGGETVALNQVQHRRLGDAVRVDPPERQRRHREIERERRTRPGATARFAFR